MHVVKHYDLAFARRWRTRTTIAGWLAALAGWLPLFLHVFVEFYADECKSLSFCLYREAPVAVDWRRLQRGAMSEEMPVLEDREEEEEEDTISSPSHGSEGMGSPEECSDSLNELKAKYRVVGEGEKVHSVNCPRSKTSVVLTSRDLWQMFDAIGTEMIVTRRGR